MIPAPHRMKGAALVLGASRPGEIGPFGPYGGRAEPDADEPDQAYAVLEAPHKPKAPGEHPRAFIP
ncbi:hypothetical protein [Streptomyces candidus]|uniref:Uncharacterized protein n=1 Tax=Streptomyces candidus TaxID=67283 RepID=A0A7X0LSP5_9ACTN|nr:hypothetical protein [Streptomyces candidus]MBB6439437.1 hypothetical protein [Streptomyces candidus]GHH54739.1 hypothetical protein GCM10018773_58200 [Streptomyces candidus]